MTLIPYVEHRFHRKSAAMIDKVNAIIADFADQGFTPTLRQLYYQLVAHHGLPNVERSYKSLGKLLTDAREAGRISWTGIEDRTRNLQAASHFDGPADILETALTSYRVDRWANQKLVPEIWIEKEALAGVIEDICDELDVPLFACRGYASASELWRASSRLLAAIDAGRTPRIYYLGDHDPSGTDMVRDIECRLRMYVGPKCRPVKKLVVRLALNPDQIERYNLPPNPTKSTDMRTANYEAQHGGSGWELDALAPDVIIDLVKKAVLSVRDEPCWKAALRQEARDRSKLKQFAKSLAATDTPKPRSPTRR